jgi:FkbM family methyltransferase
MFKSIIKKIYTVFPFKKEIFSFIKLFIKLKPGIYQHLYFNGVFDVKVKKGHSFKMVHFGYVIENELFWVGIENGWEKVSTSLWIKLCEDADHIVDVGANTGVYSLIAGCVNPHAQIYAFEPVTRVYDRLQNNIHLNRYKVNANCIALSNKNGDAIIYDIPDMEHIYSVTVNKNMFTAGTPVIETTIQTKTLDSIILEQNIPKIDLIKIDVETHEPEVLEGYMMNLKKHMPSVIIEVLTDDVGKKVESYIKDLPYLYYNIDENAGLKRVKNIVKSDYYNYLLCTEETAVKLGIFNL